MDDNRRRKLYIDRDKHGFLWFYSRYEMRIILNELKTIIEFGSLRMLV